MEFKLLKAAKTKTLEATSIFSQSELKVNRSLNKIAPDVGQASSSKAIPSIEIQTREDNEAVKPDKQPPPLLNISRQEIQKMFNSDEDDQLPTNFEDGRASRVEYQKFQIIDTSITLVGFIGAFLTILAVIIIISF